MNVLDWKKVDQLKTTLNTLVTAVTAKKLVFLMDWYVEYFVLVVDLMFR